MSINSRKKNNSEVLSNPLKIKNLSDKFLGDIGFKKIIELSPSPIALTKKGKFIFLNSSGLEMIGAISQDEIIGMNSEDFIHPDYLNSFIVGVLEDFGKGESNILETKFIRLNGEEIDVEVRVSQIIINSEEFIIIVANDITRRKSLELKNKESEELISKYFEYSYDGIGLADENGIIIKWNKALESYTELPSNLACGKKIIDIMEILMPYRVQPNEVRLKIEKSFSDFHKGIFPPITGKIIEHKLVTSDGAMKYLQSIIFPVFTTKGICLGGISRDNTIAKTAQIALDESERKITLLTENTKDIIYRLNIPDNRYEYINKACMEITGFTPEEFYSDPQIVRKNIHPDSIDVFIDDMNEIFNGNLKKIYDYKFISKSGEVKWIRRRDNLVYDQSGNPTAIEGIVTDITYIKSAEEQLKHNLEKQVLNSTIIGLLNKVDDYKLVLDKILKNIREFSDSEYVYYYINCPDEKKFTKYGCSIIDSSDIQIPDILNYDSVCGLSEELLNNEILYINDISNASDLLINYFSKYSVKSSILISVNNKQELYGFLIICNWVNINNWILKDIDLFSNIAQHLSNSIYRKNVYSELNELNAAKDKFFSIISHDLKSPIMGFLGLAQMLAESLEKYSIAQLNGFFSNMFDSTNKLYTLLNNLLEWAQLQRNTMIYSPEKIILSKLLNESINNLSPFISGKSITVENSVSSNLKIYADYHMMDSVVQNLLSNAVKFTNLGGLIKIGAENIDDNMVRIYVEDNGIGISDSDIKKLFKIDEKVSGIGTEGEMGSGLGLILCDEFIRKNNGRIWAESTEGVGTKMFIEIPNNKSKSRRKTR